MAMKKEEKQLHQYPYFLGIIIIAVISGFAQVVLILDCFFPVLTLDWNTSFLFIKKFSREEITLAVTPAAAVRAKPLKVALRMLLKSA